MAFEGEKEKKVNFEVADFQMTAHGNCKLKDKKIIIRVLPISN